jgi:hypothetical protein
MMVAVLAGGLAIAEKASGLEGVVLNQVDQPTEGVYVMASGVGLNGGDRTKVDGSFHLKAAGKYILVHHRDYNPRIFSTETLKEPIRIQLEPADGSVRRLPSCLGRGWVGGDLKVKPVRGLKLDGPVHGEHDSHWYFRFGTETLHIVESPHWYAGLPLERTLDSARNLEVHGLLIDQYIGLDLSWSTAEGRRGRWIEGALFTFLEYDEATPQAATRFDELLKSVCWQFP